MKVLHVFEEEKGVDRRAHVKAFFGVIPITGDEFNPHDGSYVVCFCGGRIYKMGEGPEKEWIGAVWHFDPKSIRRPDEESDE